MQHKSRSAQVSNSSRISLASGSLMVSSITTRGTCVIAKSSDLAQDSDTMVVHRLRGSHLPVQKKHDAFNNFESFSNSKCCWIPCRNKSKLLILYSQTDSINKETNPARFRKRQLPKNRVNQDESNPPILGKHRWLEPCWFEMLIPGPPGQ